MKCGAYRQPKATPKLTDLDDAQECTREIRHRGEFVRSDIDCRPVLRETGVRQTRSMRLHIRIGVFEAISPSGLPGDPSLPHSLPYWNHSGSGPGNLAEHQTLAATRSTSPLGNYLHP